MVLCEGYATGASIHESTGLEVLCAMTCGNLDNVAQIARLRWPQRRILLCADDDRWGQDPNRNPGRDAAKEAAELVEGFWMVPQFESDHSRPTDFNDLHILEGTMIVRHQIVRFMKKALGLSTPSSPSTPPSQPEPSSPPPPLTEPVELPAIDPASQAPPAESIPMDVCDPVELDPATAPFPTETLPEVLADMVREASRVYRVPESLTGPCVLVAVAASVGRNLRVSSGPNRSTMGNLYVLISAESGVGKSVICSCLIDPIYQNETDTQQHWEEEVKPKVQAEYELLEAELSGLTKCKPGGRLEGEVGRHETMGMVREKKRRQQELKEQLTPPRLVVENVTSEALSSILATNDETIFSGSADASDVFGVLRGGYKKDGSDESIYLKGWSGDHINVDRVNRDPVRLEQPCISTLWMTQPKRVRELFEQENFVDGGLLPRFMICHSHAKPMPIVRGIEPLSTSIMDLYRLRIDDLLSEYRRTTEPKVFEAMPDSQQLLDDYYNAIVERRSTGELEDLGVFAARWAEWAWRLAVVLHAAQHGNRAHQRPLAPETATNAIRIASWFTSQQLQLLEGIREQAWREH